MDPKSEDLLKGLESLEGEVSGWRDRIGDPSLAERRRRWLADLEALRFHLGGETGGPPMVTLLGGTGTGKSTLVNRLLEGEFSATSFRRTYTTGPIVFLHPSTPIPEGWSGAPCRSVEVEALPAQGEAGSLLLAPLDRDCLKDFSLVDTPDVDGDADSHYDQADRIFRWSRAAIFLVTPEKYQMTELIPFYRMSKRYETPTLYVMNKCESGEVVEDYRKQLAKRGCDGARIFVIPRDDSIYEPDESVGLEALRMALPDLRIAETPGLARGVGRRTEDALRRLLDQLTAPLREDRTRVRSLAGALRAFAAPGPNLDLSPLTVELQERMRTKSILYLIGPQRILDRARQVSTAVYERVKTPGAWFGRTHTRKSQEGETIEVQALPDFRSLAVDQFRIGQTRLKDILEGDERARVWRVDPDDPSGWIDPEEAGAVVDEEIEKLNLWLKERWDATPRDTQTILGFLNRIPGGKKIIEWSEASPYLLVAVAAASGTLLGPIDFLIIGGYSLATWMGEKLSNEVTARVRQTNKAVYRRFETLMKEQIRLRIEWLERQAPDEDSLLRVEEESERLAGLLGASGEI